MQNQALQNQSLQNQILCIDETKTMKAERIEAGSNLLTRRPKNAHMELVTLAFYVILFLLAFMIARIIMKIMRGY